MRNNKVITIILCMLLMATILTIAFFVTGRKQGGLMGSGFTQQITKQQSIPTPAPVAKSNAPKTFNFDSSTDLKAELEKVNPQVLDSDFE